MTFLHHTGEHLARFVGRTTAKPTNPRTSTTPLLEMEDGCSGNLLCTTNARLIQSTWLHMNVFKCNKDCFAKKLRVLLLVPIEMFYLQPPCFKFLKKPYFYLLYIYFYIDKFYSIYMYLDLIYCRYIILHWCTSRLKISVYFMNFCSVMQYNCMFIFKVMFCTLFCARMCVGVHELTN